MEQVGYYIISRGEALRFGTELSVRKQLIHGTPYVFARILRSHETIFEAVDLLIATRSVLALHAVEDREITCAHPLQISGQDKRQATR